MRWAIKLQHWSTEVQGGGHCIQPDRVQREWIKRALKHGRSAIKLQHRSTEARGEGGGGAFNQLDAERGGRGILQACSPFRSVPCLSLAFRARKPECSAETTRIDCYFKTFNATTTITTLYLHFTTILFYLECSCYYFSSSSSYYYNYYHHHHHYHWY